MTGAGGRTAGASVREEIRAPLRRVLAWLLSLRDGEGRIVCPEHRVEHTGKSAGALVLALELLELDEGRDAEALRAAALQQGRRLVANLVCEEDSVCHTFRPGRHDPFNCANSVIDGGACSDALAQLVLQLGPELEAADRDAFREASLLHARSYLRYAVLDKGIPAQRAWGLAGLAAANELAPEPVLEQAALEAVGVLEAIQHEDGSYPYHPLEWGAEHPGASDVSAFYQSRVTAFLFHALERLGRDPASGLFRGPLRRGLEFLRALQGPDGLKCGLVEAKPWYWGAIHEVASHPFDVHAFARGWRHFRRPALAQCAVRAFRAWAERLEQSGRPRSHLPGPGRGRSYQCPVFWAGHAMWLARAARDLEDCMSRPEAPATQGAGLDIGVEWFPSAALGRLEDGAVVAWVRGARPAVNVAHGSPHGAGLLRVVRKRDLAELVERARDERGLEGEWCGRAGGWAPLRGWRAGAKEVRFSVWRARVHLRAGRRAEALLTPPRTLSRGVLAYARPCATSAWELAPRVLVQGDGLALEGRLAHRDGTPVEGSRVERSFRLDGDGLAVDDRLRSAGGARGVRYRLPAAARDVREEDGRFRYRLG